VIDNSGSLNATRKKAEEVYRLLVAAEENTYRKVR